MQLLVPLQVRLRPHTPGASSQVIEVPLQPPEPLQSSPQLQASPSLQLVSPPGKVSVHVLVPLQARFAPQTPGSSVHVTVVPAQVPDPLQSSLYVQVFPSSQVVAPPGKVSVQVFVPLQERLAPQTPAPSLHRMSVPPQPPPPLHLSPQVQASPSLQLVSAPGWVSVQLLVPLQLRFMPQTPASSSQVTEVPPQPPDPEHRSL